MNYKEQLERQVREACIFLRENNQTIPSDVIEFMKAESISSIYSEKKNALINAVNSIPVLTTSNDNAIYNNGDIIDFPVDRDTVIALVEGVL